MKTVKTLLLHKSKIIRDTVVYYEATKIPAHLARSFQRTAVRKLGSGQLFKFNYSQFLLQRTDESNSTVNADSCNK